MTALSQQEHRDAATMLLAQVRALSKRWSPDPDDVRIGLDALPYLAAAQVHATLAGVTPGPQLPSVDITESVRAEAMHGRWVAVVAGTGGAAVLCAGDPSYHFTDPGTLRRLAAALLGHADRIERGTT